MFAKIYLTLAFIIDVLLTILCFSGNFTYLTVLTPIVLYIPIYLALFLLHILVTFIISLFLNKNKVRLKPNKFLRFWVDYTVEWLLSLLNVKIEVIGQEKLPKNTRFLLVSNHASGIDPLVCMAKLKEYNISFVAKPEIFKIPMVAPFLAACCFMTIDRENARKAMKTIHLATDYIKNNAVSVGIYPEGTRSKTGELQEFKDGVFYIAKKAPCPVVVSTVIGTDKFKKNTPFKQTKVKINIIDVIYPQDFSELSTHDISEKIHGIMSENLK